MILQPCSYAESKLSGVVVHPAAVHEREDVPYADWVQDHFPGGRTNASIGQGSSHYGKALRIDFQGAKLLVRTRN